MRCVTAVLTAVGFALVIAGGTKADHRSGGVALRLQTPDAQPSGLLAVAAISGDGKTYVYIDGNKVILQRTGEAPFPLPLDGSVIRALALSADGKRLACEDRYGNMSFWSVDNPGKPLPPEQALDRALFLDPFAKIIALDPTGDELLSCFGGTKVKTYQAQSSSTYHTPDLKQAVFSVDTHASIKCLAYYDKTSFIGADRQGNIRLYAKATGTSQPIGKMEAVSSIAYDREHSLLVAIGMDGSARLWNLKNKTSPQPVSVRTDRAPKLVAVTLSSINATVATLSGIGADHKLVSLPLTLGSDQKSLVDLQNEVRDAYNKTLSAANSGEPVAAGALDLVRQAQSQTANLPDSLRKAHTAQSERRKLAQDLVGLQGDLQKLQDTATKAEALLTSVPTTLNAALKKDAISAEAVLTQPITRNTDLDTLKKRLKTLQAGIEAVSPQITEALDAANSVTAALAATAELPKRLAATTNRITELINREFILNQNAMPRPLPVQGNSDPVSMVAFDPADATLLASGGKDGIVRLWNSATGEARKGYPHPAAVNALAFRPDGGLLASGGYDKQIKLWNVSEGRELTPSRPLNHAGVVRVAAFHPNGNVLASGIVFDPAAVRNDKHGGVVLWNLTQPEDPQQIGQPLLLDYAVNAIAYSPKGDRLAVGCNDGIYVYEIQSGGGVNPQPIRLVGGGDQVVIYALAFLDDDTLVSFKGNTLLTWNLTGAGKELSPSHSWQAQKDPRSLAYSSTRKLLAVGCKDGSLLVWDVRDLNQPSYPQLAIPAAHQDAVLSLNFDVNGEMLASGGKDKALLVWDVWDWAR